MPITNRLPDGLTKVDFIVCGGGVGGCVIAGRLAEADPQLSVLVIEGGENNEGKPTIKHPALYPQNVALTSTYATFHTGKKSDVLAGRSVVIPTGGVLGGGSSINFMLYSRAQGVDFDAWETPGWSAKDIIPFMEKLENYRGPGKDTHGFHGPVQIGASGAPGNKSQDDIMRTAERLGYTVYDDLENPEKYNNGVERCLKYVTTDGYRADAAHAYLHPLLQDGEHPNLHVLCESKINRVLFDEHKYAVGVEYSSNSAFHPALGLSPHLKTTILARKLVVLSCGALGTPSVLERSGVGRREILTRASVPLVAEVPGVGENYDDHQLILYSWRSNLAPEDTNDRLYRGEMSMDDAETQDYLKWNNIDAHGKIRPTADEIAALGPAFQAAWDRDFSNQPNRPLMMFASMACFLGDPAAVAPGQYFSIGVYSAYSYSRGSIHITGPSWEDPVDFDIGFLSDADDIDLKMHIWGYKRIRALMRSTDMYTGDVEFAHPQFPKGSDAAGPSPTPTYTAEDDKAIEKFIRETLGSTYHSLGTTKMAPFEEDGVVDPHLNVYGVQGLKCCDLGIAPKMVAANANNTAFTIGEKGADIIMRELGLVKHLTNGLPN